MKINNKAQEEIVGFVAIVLIVSIILIVFLGIFLRKDKSGLGSVEVSQFLDAIMETTTTCSVGGYYKEYSELVKRCNEGLDCSGENSCDILKKYTKEMIENSWNFGDDNVKKAYMFDVVFESNGNRRSLPSFPLSRGPAGPSSFIGNERSIPVTDGDVIISLKFYLE